MGLYKNNFYEVPQKWWSIQVLYTYNSKKKNCHTQKVYINRILLIRDKWKT